MTREHTCGFAALVLGATLSVVACTSIDCPVQNTVSCIYKVMSTDGSDGMLEDTLNVFTIRIDGTDSLLLNRCVNTKTFSLPISYTNAEDTLVFKMNNRGWMTIDTVYVSKENHPQFESVDCQLAFFHTITAVRWTTEYIDSIAIIKPSVNYDTSTPHLHIYFKTRP